MIQYYRHDDDMLEARVDTETKRQADRKTGGQGKTGKAERNRDNNNCGRTGKNKVIDARRQCRKQAQGKCGVRGE